MKTEINVLKKIKPKSTILIEGLPGIGNVGRIAAGYLVSELKMKKFAELYSPYLLPLVILHENNLIEMLKYEFFYKRIRGKDIVVLTGDSQSIVPQGHYMICDLIINFAKKMNTSLLVTLGGYATDEIAKEPSVIIALNNKKLLKKYKKFLSSNHSIGTIVGASGLLIGLAQKYNIDGICLMGKTLGFPQITDPVAADSVLNVLKDIVKIDINLTKLEESIKEMEKRIKKTEKIHKQMIEQMMRKDEDIRYIG